MGELRNKIVLITGCSSGIGLEAALAFAREGAIVYATMRSPEKGKELSLRAKKEGLPLCVLPLDVTKPASIAAAVKFIMKKEKTIDVLVNNAGYGLFGSLGHISMASLREQYETNVFGLVECIQQCLPYMKEGAKIINVSSVVGHIGIPMMGAYCSTKFAVEGLSESLRRELFAKNIWVTVVEPGSTQTKFSSTSLQQGIPKSNPEFSRGMKLREKFLQRSGFSDSADFVARDIVRIAKKHKPALRYGVGFQGRLGGLLVRILPNRLIDFAFKILLK